jgi:predicted transcriptional regulator
MLYFIEAEKGEEVDSAIKNNVQKMINQLPENCTYEDIQYHLYVIEKITNGINRSRRGEVSTHEEAKKRMSRWLSS